MRFLSDEVGFSQKKSVFLDKVGLRGILHTIFSWISEDVFDIFRLLILGTNSYLQNLTRFRCKKHMELREREL